MADCIDDGHVTSDEYLDPRCEPCFDSKKRSVHVYGYCHECYKFMCSECHSYHGQFPLAKNHVIVRGSKMPKSLADKPQKYERCDDHPGQWKEKFCCDHKELMCSTCADTDHKTCLNKSVDDLCKTIPSSEINFLRNVVKHLNDEVHCMKVAVEADIDDLAEQRKHLMQESKDIHEKVNSKVNELFQSIQSEIAEECMSQNERLNNYEAKVTDIDKRTEESLYEIKMQKGKSIDAKSFLMIQKHVQSINQIADHLRTLNLTRRLVSLSFDPSNLLKEIVSYSATFGSLKKEESRPDVIEVNDITFPQSSSPSVPSIQVTARPRANQQSQPLSAQTPESGDSDQSSAASLISLSCQSVNLTRPQSQQSTDSRQRQDDNDQPATSKQTKGNTARNRSVLAPTPPPQIKTTKQNSYNIKLKDGRPYCWITGMAITNDKRRRLLVDFSNNNVKLFSADKTFLSLFSTDMKFLSSVSVPDSPWDISVVNDDTAIVTTNNYKLVILDISRRQLSISRTVKLDYSAWGIASCKDKLFVTCPCTEPPCVKMIDRTGAVYWSVSTDQHGRQLFEDPRYLCCHYDGGSSTVVVTDRVKNSQTLLKAATGEVVTARQLVRNKRPLGVTNDKAGNVYVCYEDTSEVAVLTGDLSEEKILLTRNDGLRDSRPVAIVYDATRRQLVVSYCGIHGSSIDWFQLP